MQQTFTQKAKESISNSQSSACVLKHNYVGTEHILLGLLSISDSTACRALKIQKITEKIIEDKILEISPSLLKQSKAPKNFTPRAKKIIELSLQEALKVNSKNIGTEHILLAILSQIDCLAVKILTDLKVNLNQLNFQLLNNLNFMPSPKPSTKTPQPDRFAKYAPRSTTPTLDKFSRDFTKLAKENKFDQVIGRENEIERVIQILSRRSKNNPCLVGDPGVGKTALAEGLAIKISEDNIPENLKNKRVVSLSMSNMVAGSKYRGEFEERIKKVIEEVIADKNIILFIDEVHTVIGAGAAEGAIDAANILKPALARGDLQIIGATTLNEYRKTIEKDSALERRFQLVTINEPSEEIATKMLFGIKNKYEEHHNVTITDEAIIASVKLSSRYITDRFLPDKAIDLIDEASSKIKIKNLFTPPDIKKMKLKIENFEIEKENAIKKQDFLEASSIKKKQDRLQKKLETTLSIENNPININIPIVNEEIIAEIVESWTGIPVKKLQSEESSKLINLETLLHNRVIGQSEAVASVAKAIRRGRVGLKNPARPIGSFLFLGPTGVGKTELSKALADVVFGNESYIIRIDMSEYMDKHSTSKLIGPPPGYVGYDDGSHLTEKIRRKQYSVVLFDEIEKAHPDVFNLLLQVLDDGHITDSQGRKIDFKNTIIIMTSNAGAKSIISPKKLGFTSNFSESRDYNDMKNGVLDEIKHIFKPEFLNRIDDIIVFHTLDKVAVNSIVALMVNVFIDRVKINTSITAKVTDACINHLAEKGFDPAFGARPLRRAIQSLLEDELASLILEGTFSSNDKILIDCIDNNITFKKIENLKLIKK